ncbi:MAG TPA: copper resistance protein B [Steroidobacteraceae bacterium]|nr:copper resistance protein B [Steroidobacteraceae bacterium]
MTTRLKTSLTAHAIGVVLWAGSLNAIAQTPDLPPITDADRAAAFPDLPGHAAHDRAINYYVLFDQLEWQNASEGSALNWDASAWIGGDLDRLILRTQGESESGHTAKAELEALWGHAFARWWDLVAGVRQDPRPGPSQTWGAFGVRGLAPYKFELAATAYIGESGQTSARFEAEYELLFTNRLILQPRIEFNLYGKDDLQRAVGSGLSTSEVGLRLRYELRREFAPYIGVTWNRKWGDTADFARTNGEDTDETRVVAGFRIWF